MAVLYFSRSTSKFAGIPVGVQRDKALTNQISQRHRRLNRENAQRRGPRYRSLLAHWARAALRTPVQPKVAPLPQPSKGQLSLSFAGHATTLIQYSNLAILCDPMFGNWRGPCHREMSVGLVPAELADIDLILISNQNPDHLHPKSLEQLPKSATVIVPPHTAHLVSEFGFSRVMELGAGQDVEHRGVEISTIEMCHGNRKAPTLGYMLRGDGPSLFFCGCSGYFGGFEEIGATFQPEIAILPIGGYLPQSFRKEHMSPLDALEAFEDLNAKIMVPIRYGSFSLSYETLQDPRNWLDELIVERGLQGYVVPIEVGKSRLFVSPEPNKVRAATMAEDGGDEDEDE